MKSHKNINIYRLNKYLKYHPSWYKDKIILFKLFKQSKFTDKDIINFGRINVKYNHIKDIEELTQYFNYIIKQMNFNNPEELYSKTQQTYHTHEKNHCN